MQTVQPHLGNQDCNPSGSLSSLFFREMEQGEEVNLSDARIGQWTTVNLTGQIIGIHVDPEFVELDIMDKSLRVNIPMKNVELISLTEHLATD